MLTHSRFPGAEKKQARAAERLQKEGPLQPLTSPEPEASGTVWGSKMGASALEVYQWLSFISASLR